LDPPESINYASDVTQIFKKEIVRLHGIPKKILSNRDVRFTSRFWKGLCAGLGTHLAFSTSYQTQIDGKAQKTNIILKDMLRMYIMHQPKKWEEYLTLMEFSYNNGYQESINMSPFEVLYGKR